MTDDDKRSPSPRRRDVLRWLSVSAFGGVLLPRTTLAAAFLQAGARPTTFPPGTVIRTILKDMMPDEIVRADALPRAHVTQQGLLGPDGRRDGARGPPRLGVPPGETYFLEDPELIVREMRRQAGRRRLLRRRRARGHGSKHRVPEGCVDSIGDADRGERQLLYAAVSPRRARRHERDDLAARLVREGAAERWGAYGEIASSTEMTDGERKVFRAVGKAHLRTGLAIFTHNTGPKHAVDQLDILTGVGVKPEKIAIGHLGDINDPKAEVHQAICKRGAYVGFDRGIGERQARMIKVLADAGYRDRVLMSSDFAIAQDTKARGGPGYAKTMILGRPELQKAGVDQETVTAMLVDNPRRFLAFVSKTS